MGTKALVVLSGGQDSTTCLWWAKRYFEEIHAVTFDYGQKHRIEIDSALKIGKLAGVLSHTLVKVGALAGRSPLTNPDEKLEKYNTYDEMDKVIGDRVELTFVPGRNTIFLSYAMNIAVAKDIWNIVTGVCQADNANYPDCRQVYVTALQRAFNESLGTVKKVDSDFAKMSLEKLSIRTPLMYLTKKETVALSLSLTGCYEALAYSHTSYDGVYPPTDNNHSNVLRAQGFLEAGVPDPLVLRAWYEGLMELPTTSNYNTFKDAKPKAFRDLTTVLKFARS